MTDDDSAGTTRDQAIEQIIERVAATIGARYGHTPDEYRADARALADAGLLRGGGDTDDEARQTVDRRWNAWREAEDAKAEVKKLRAERDQAREAHDEDRRLWRTQRARIEKLADEFQQMEDESPRGPFVIPAAGLAAQLRAAIRGGSDD